MAYDIEMKYKSEFLREMTRQNLTDMLKKAQQRFYELRQQSSPHGQVKLVEKPHLFKKIRKDIARMKTILAE